MAAHLRPARAAFREWLSMPGRTQALLADALEIAQQTVSALCRARIPSPELAKLIEEATGIPWRGWFTERELDREERRVASRLERARALRGSITSA